MAVLLLVHQWAPRYTFSTVALRVSRQPGQRLGCVVYNPGSTVGWLIAACPCAHHRELSWFVPRCPMGHGTWPPSPSPGHWALGASRAYALKQPEMFSPSRKQSLICTSVSRSLIIDRGSFYRCFLVSGLLCFPGFPEGW